MQKLIILTTAIIRGEFHKNSIGKFYDYFFKYLENKYEIHHIINIDEPENLQTHFNKYETIDIFNSIVPKKINKIYITETNRGFLQAYKKIISKIEELNLINDSYLYYWLEDDWEPKCGYNIFAIFDKLCFLNSAYTITEFAPLGSFKGGPFMTGTYFKNIFNIKKYMNDTCDPERQMQRWLRGGCQKNGNLSINRFDIINTNVVNDLIHIIIVCEESNINLLDLNKHHYNTGFDKSIKFKYHLLSRNLKWNIKYSVIDDFNNYYLIDIDNDDLKTIFGNKSIKYFVIQPDIMRDIGREFNKKFGLIKWMRIEDDTSYTNINVYNAYLGNWKLMSEMGLRLRPRITMNKGFFSALAYIHQCLPYLENNYFNKNIKLNIQYYSHNYGSYPNFNVIGNLIKLNYIPSINKDNNQFKELKCLAELCKNICGKQTSCENTLQFMSYKDNFELANHYLFKYFKFNENIITESNNFIKQFKNKYVLGLHYRGTDKNNVKYITPISINEFINIVDYHLKKNNYDIIFISTDDDDFITQMKDTYSSKYEILYYDDCKKNENNNAIHLNRLHLIETKITEIKNNIDNTDKIVLLESNLKRETKINEVLLQNVIINSFILSHCMCVLKTHSQLSAYSKIFNPKLEIYRVNACIEGYWPDSHIKLYDYKNINDNDEVRELLKTKLLREFDDNKKHLYKTFDLQQK